MNKIESTKQEVSIVAVGSLNPKIFHPQWFSKNELIKEKEAEGANIKIINNDFSIFDCEWLDVTIDRNRLQVRTSQDAYYSTLRDLALGTFTILEHVPLTKIGINCHHYYQFPSEQSIVDFGKKIIPSSNWDKVINYQKFVNLTINADRDNEFDGYYQIHVNIENPEKRIVKIGFNDHYDLDEAKDSIIQLKAIINSSWKNALSESLKVAEHLLSL